MSDDLSQSGTSSKCTASSIACFFGGKTATGEFTFDTNNKYLIKFVRAFEVGFTAKMHLKLLI